MSFRFMKRIRCEYLSKLYYYTIKSMMIRKRLNMIKSEIIAIPAYKKDSCVGCMFFNHVIGKCRRNLKDWDKLNLPDCRDLAWIYIVESMEIIE